MGVANAIVIKIRHSCAKLSPSSMYIINLEVILFMITSAHNDEASLPNLFISAR